MDPSALETASSMSEGVSRCCTQRGQGTWAATPRVHPGAVARYWVMICVVALPAEYDAGVIFRFGSLQCTQAAHASESAPTWNRTDMT